MKKIQYCPYCDTYDASLFSVCMLCSSPTVLWTTWDKMNEEEKKEWMKRWPRHNPPEQLRGVRIDLIKEDDAKARAEIAAEKAAEEARKQYVPHCPTCGCPDLEKVGAGEKLASVAVWGVFSKKPRVQFRCKNCVSAQ